MLQIKDLQVGQIIRWNGNLVSIQRVDHETIRFWESSRSWRIVWKNSPEWNMEVEVKNETMKFWESSKNQRQVWNL